MEYLHWKEETIKDFSDNHVADLYDEGFVFTRMGKGIMHQTRSVRIKLSDFELSSENRRILKKVENIILKVIYLPEDIKDNYDWKIHKMGYDFYLNKFGEDIFSANKIKELITNPLSSNFNRLFAYTDENQSEHGPLGYSICFTNEKILHYSYPFYDLEKAPKDMGMGMMTKAIVWAKQKGLKYVYLGSLQRPSDGYKLQFSGLEWFDGGEWRKDLDEAKEVIKKI